VSSCRNVARLCDFHDRRKRMVASRQAFVPLSTKCRAGNIYTISATHSIEVRDNNETRNLSDLDVWTSGDMTVANPAIENAPRSTVSQLRSAK
jgi:hypothetical protein